MRQNNVVCKREALLATMKISSSALKMPQTKKVTFRALTFHMSHIIFTAWFTAD